MYNKPSVFWRKIKDLGSSCLSKSKNLPNSILDENKQMVTNPNEVLETWKAYFQSLLNTKASLPQSQPDSGLGSEVEMDSFLNEQDHQQFLFHQEVTHSLKVDWRHLQTNFQTFPTFQSNGHSYPKLRYYSLQVFSIKGL